MAPQYSSAATLPRQPLTHTQSVYEVNQSATLPLHTSQNTLRNNNNSQYTASSEIWTEKRHENRRRYSGRSLPDRSHARMTSQPHQSQHFSQIDIGAMEHDALSHTLKTQSGVMRQAGGYHSESEHAPTRYRPDVGVGIP